jgi:hypothetical protein
MCIETDDRADANLTPLMQVQAAEKARPAQNLFQSRGNTSQGSTVGSIGDPVNSARATAPPAANQSSLPSQQQRSDHRPRHKLAGSVKTL